MPIDRNAPIYSAEQIASIFTRKLTSPKIKPDVESAEFYAGQLSNPPYLRHLPKLHYLPDTLTRSLNENTLIGMLVCLSLNYPEVFDRILSELQRDNSFVKNLAFHLATLSIDPVDKALRKRFLEKIIESSVGNDDVCDYVKATLVRARF